MLGVANRGDIIEAKFGNFHFVEKLDDGFGLVLVIAIDSENNFDVKTKGDSLINGGDSFFEGTLTTNNVMNIRSSPIQTESNLVKFLRTK